MKAGIVVDNEFINDIRVRREAEILKTNGYDVHVLCLGFKTSYGEVKGIKTTRIPVSRKVKDTLFFFLNLIPLYEWIWAMKISKFIRRNTPDILHVHDLYMAKAAHTGIKRSGMKIPMILDLHENYPFQVTTYNWTKGFLRNLLSNPSAWKKKERRYLGYADRIIVLSEEYRDSLMGEYPEMKEDLFTVYPNVPDVAAPEYHVKTTVGNPFQNGYPILLYYGIIAGRRGIFETLDVFSDLVREGHKVNLLLIGPVDKKDRKLFNEKISPGYYKGRLIHIPWINMHDFPGYLEISDICLAPFRRNPQHESGVANKVYDYMLGGKPLLVSDCGPQKNLVEKHTCGLVFSNHVEYKEAIINLIDNEMLRIALGLNGRKSIFSFYNSSVFKGNLFSVYGDLLDKA